MQKKIMLNLKIQQLLVEAEFKEGQLVANRMTLLWPGQFANVCCHRRWPHQVQLTPLPMPIYEALIEGSPTKWGLLSY